MYSRIHNFAFWVVALTCVATTGCSMCCGPFDYDYATFGGKHTRTHRDYGRVGSPFSDPSGFAGGPAADSNLQPIEPAPDIDLDEGLDDDISDLESGLGDDVDSEFDGNLETIEPEPLREKSTSPEPSASSDSDRSAKQINRWRPTSLRTR